MSSRYTIHNDTTGLDVDLPSPTGIFRDVGISTPPLQWAANCAVDKYIEVQDAERAKKEWSDASKTALDIGSAVHRAIKWHISKGGPLTVRDDHKHNAEVKNCYAAFNAWVNDCKPTFLQSERQVVNWNEWYAGTLDVVCEINGMRVVVDYKTSKEIDKHQYGMQAEAYRHAWNGMLGKNCIELWCQYSAILRLDKSGKGYDFYIMSDDDQKRQWSAFRALIDYWYKAKRRKLKNNERAEASA